MAKSIFSEEDKQGFILTKSGELYNKIELAGKKLKKYIIKGNCFIEFSDPKRISDEYEDIKITLSYIEGGEDIKRTLLERYCDISFEIDLSKIDDPDYFASILGALK